MRKMLKSGLTSALVVATLSMCLYAMAQQVGKIRVLDAWVRATVPGQSNGAAYLKLENQGKDADRLLSVTSQAGQVQLHNSAMVGEMMQMRELDNLPLPASSKVLMQPGKGPHLMITGLKQPLQAGQTVVLTLKFEKAGNLTLPVKIEAQARP